MSCLLTTTQRIRRASRDSAASALASRITHGSAFDAPGETGIGSTAATPIIDWLSPAVRRLAANAGGADDREILRSAHTLIQRHARPVYSLAERRPASGILARGRGSCSQRLAVLEAVARARGIATRTRGLLVDGAYWRPRFGILAPLLPERILLAWPQFHVDGVWVDASDLFVAAPDATPFTNVGAETLFDAVGHGTARWTPYAADCSCNDGPLPAAPRELGFFPSRDDLFRRYGQNLPCAVRTLVEPVFGRWAAGAGVPRVG